MKGPAKIYSPPLGESKANTYGLQPGPTCFLSRHLSFATESNLLDVVSCLMLHVGLTGSIGSGKSTVASIFAEHGAHVIDADAVAHALLDPGTEVNQKIIREFGESIVQPDGTIDRKSLGKIVFASPEKRQLLNSIVHPAVRTVILGRIVELEQKIQTGIAVIDAALMVESGFYKLFDKIVVAACSEGVQISRIMSRDGFTAEEARARIAAQMPMAEKVKYANYVIETSGTLRQTREQAEAVYRDLIKQELRLRIDE